MTEVNTAMYPTAQNQSNDPASAIQKAMALKKMQMSMQQLGQGQPYGQTGQPSNVAAPSASDESQYSQ